MNEGKKYDELADAIKREEDPKEKINLMAIMLCMMAKNDLACIDNKIKKIKRNQIRLLGGMILIFLTLLIRDPEAANAILNLLRSIF